MGTHPLARTAQSWPLLPALGSQPSGPNRTPTSGPPYPDPGDTATHFHKSSEEGSRGCTGGCRRTPPSRARWEPSCPDAPGHSQPPAHWWALRFTLRSQSAWPVRRMGSGTPLGTRRGNEERGQHISRREFCPRTLPQPAPVPVPGSAAQRLRNPVYSLVLAPAMAPLQHLPGRAVTESKVPLLTEGSDKPLLPLQPLVCGKGRTGWAHRHVLSGQARPPFPLRS